EGERLIAAGIVDDAQRRLRIARRDEVEVVARPVEVRELRPAELALRRLPVLPVPQQLVTQLDEASARIPDRHPHAGCVSLTSPTCAVPRQSGRCGRRLRGSIHYD